MINFISGEKVEKFSCSCISHDDELGEDLVIFKPNFFSIKKVLEQFFSIKIKILN
jgi:hypothetical protein